MVHSSKSQGTQKLLFLHHLKFTNKHTLKTDKENEEKEGSETIFIGQ